MVSLKSPCMTSYSLSIETIAVNCLVFEQITFLHFGDRQTYRETNRHTDGQARRIKPPLAINNSFLQESQWNH